MAGCKDCLSAGITTSRPAPHPGPRCFTHHKSFQKAQKLRKHSLYTQRNYGLPEGMYAILYAFQGGKCSLCLRATGLSKNLAIDHDHSCCPGPASCGKCVRGLVCGPCNSVFSQARDSVDFFSRAIDYLTDPPYHRLLRGKPEETQ